MARRLGAHRAARGRRENWKWQEASNGDEYANRETNFLDPDTLSRYSFEPIGVSSATNSLPVRRRGMNRETKNPVF